MSFVPNECQQMTLDDQYYSFTAREQKFLKKSWAVYFADHVFSKINEERFSCLYSDNPATRPSTKVNVIVGAFLFTEKDPESVRVCFHKHMHMVPHKA